MVVESCGSCVPGVVASVKVQALAVEPGPVASQLCLACSASSVPSAERLIQVLEAATGSLERAVAIYYE